MGVRLQGGVERTGGEAGIIRGIGEGVLHGVRGHIWQACLKDSGVVTPGCVFHLGIGERAIHRQEFAEEWLEAKPPRAGEHGLGWRSVAVSGRAQSLGLGPKRIGDFGHAVDVVIEGKHPPVGAFRDLLTVWRPDAQGVFLLVVLFESRDAIERHLVGKLFQLAFGLIDFEADKFEIALCAGVLWVQLGGGFKVIGGLLPNRNLILRIFHGLAQLKTRVAEIVKSAVLELQIRRPQGTTEMLGRLVVFPSLISGCAGIVMQLRITRIVPQ